MELFLPPLIAAAQITDASAVGQAVITAFDEAAARAAIGAGTSSFSGAYSALTGIPSTFAPAAHTQAASTISDSTAVGRAVLTAIDAAAARTAIGAGTSSFSGAYSALTGIPTTFPVDPASVVTIADTQTVTGPKTFESAGTLFSTDMTTGFGRVYITDDGTRGIVSIRNETSPGVNASILGRLYYRGRDSAGSLVNVVELRGVMEDATAASEDGYLAVYVQQAGTNTLQLEVGRDVSFDAKDAAVVRGGPTVATPSFVAGAATVAGGGAGTHHAALTVLPSATQDDQTGLLIVAPDSGWGTSQPYAEGQAILYLNETNDVRFRVDRNGGVGFTGGLHVSPGANGAPTAGVTQAAWLQPLVGTIVPLVADVATSGTADVALFRSNGGLVSDLRVRSGSLGTSVGHSLELVGPSAGGSFVTHNARWDGTNWRRKALGEAYLFAQTSQAHQFFYAASAAADSIITWTSFGFMSANGMTVSNGSAAATPTSASTVYSVSGRPYTKGTDGIEVPLDAVRTYRLAAAATATSTALVAAITTPSLPAGTYAFEVEGFYIAAGAAALRTYITAGGTVTTYVAGILQAVTATTMFGATTQTNGSLLGSGTNPTASTLLPVKLSGSVVTSTAGTLTLSVASSAAINMSLQSGTFMRVTRIA